MRAVTIAILGWALMLGAGAAAAIDFSKPQPFNIPPQPLSAALVQFSDQAGVQFAAPGQSLEGVRTGGVQGEYPTGTALQQLLKDTGFGYRQIDAATIAISRLSSDTSRGSNSASVKEGKEGRNGNGSSNTFRMAQLDQGAAATAASITAADSPHLELQEVVVTAQKRPERLIDTPQSVSVLSAADLDKLGAIQFRDFANTVPGLSFSTAGAGNTQITLRGVTVGYDISSTVGTYVDEVPYGSSTVFNQGAQFGFDAALFDLSRIEVLRGPQGTLYGASAMGGLIKYVTQRPDTNRLGGDARAGVSSTGDGGGINYELAGSVNLPITADKAAVRVTGYQSHDGGFIDNLALGQKDANRSNVYGGRLDLLLTPTDALSIRLVGFAQDITRKGEGTVDYTNAGAQPYGALGQYRKFNEPFQQQFRLASATLGYDLGPATLTSISAYQRSHLNVFWDISAVYVPFGLCACSAIGLPNDATTDKFTEEVRLASNPGSGPLEWVLGGFYNHEASRTYEQFNLLGLTGTALANDLYTYFVPTTFQEYAAFGDLTWHITSKLDVTGGLRDAHNNQEFAQFGSGLLGKSAPASTSSESVVTYLADARYHLSDHATTYLRYATGYRPGGPNIVTVAGGPRTFQSDSLRSYEVGLKAQTAEGRFGIDVDGYVIRWSNIQIGVISNGFQTYTNASGGATVQGAELTLTAHPTDPLTTTAAFAYQHAYMNRGEPLLKAAQGERLPNVPRFTGSVNADYAFSREDLRPTVGATVRYVGERHASFDESITYPQYILPDYAAVDLRAGLQVGSFNTQLYIHNLLDKRGQLSIIYPQFGPRVAITQPRTIGVQVSTQF